ncbi:hypothetical protein ASZ90_015802 [hydrocarbon metagenome]|uniref:Uncharacterized protein n=1 Tax=hydrocarbon metagenome TaxID=938273 RepID=A0A0W8F160_9ZZZZ
MLVIQDLLLLKCRETPELHLEYGICLRLVQRETGDEDRSGGIHRIRCPDRGDHVIDAGEGDEETVQDMNLLERFFQVELGPAPDHGDTVLDKVLEEAVQGEDLWLVIDDRIVDRPETGLECGMPVQVVQDDRGHRSFPELEDDPDPILVGLVPDIGDAIDSLLPDHLRDRGDPLRLVDLVRELGHDDPVTPAPARRLLDGCHTADYETPLAGGIHVPCTLRAHQDPASREVGGRQDTHQVFHRHTRVVEVYQDGIAGLAQVVRGHLGRHTDRDAIRAVHEQVRDLCREHDRFFERLVVVGDKSNGLLLDILEHGLGIGREPDLGVPARGCRVPINGPEVPLALDEHVPVRERLGHLDDRVVDGGIAMGMELPHHLPDHPRALLGRLVARVPHLPHRVQGTTVDRFQPVSGIRDGTADDDAHRVIDIGGLHLLLYADRLHAGGDHGRAVSPCLLRCQGSSPPGRGA